MEGINDNSQIDVDIISLDGSRLSNFTPPSNTSSYKASKYTPETM